jgi:hypothetical protein
LTSVIGIIYGLKQVIGMLFQIKGKLRYSTRASIAALYLTVGCFTASAASGADTMTDTSHAASQAVKETPADQIPEGAEKEAWLLLKRAHDARQVMPTDFQGFDADVVFTDDQREYHGKVIYRKSTGTKIDIANLQGEPLDWLNDKLASFIGHRRGDSFAEGDGKNAITFGPEDQSNYGRLVELHDRMNSKYRVKDNKVLEVTRTTPDSTFTISVIESMQADPGKYLSKHFLVSYRNVTNGELEQVDGFRDKYEKIDGVWLPQRRIVLTVTKDNTSPRTRRIELSEISVVKNPAP